MENKNYKMRNYSHALNKRIDMIPKIIHYCWFGGKSLPRSARKCIASWRKFFSDYKIVEWNESNFDVNMIPYTAGAYAAKKYAFVSDFVRFWILYHQGGVYFDTDVEVVRSMDDIIRNGAFMGIQANVFPTDPWTVVNPGLGMGSEAGHKVWERIIKKYQEYESWNIGVTVCDMISYILKENEVTLTQKGGNFMGITIYPADYFCPQSHAHAPIHITENTRSIHHFDGTWLPFHVRLKMRLLGLLPYAIASRLRKYKSKFRSE